VFIDIERLRAGKFDESLLESVKQASSFIIVLTPNALDRCIGDDDRKDWVHKVRQEIKPRNLLPSTPCPQILQQIYCFGFYFPIQLAFFHCDLILIIHQILDTFSLYKHVHVQCL
jgi:hypothetical protein